MSFEFDTYGINFVTSDKPKCIYTFKHKSLNAVLKTRQNQTYNNNINIILHNFSSHAKQQSPPGESDEAETDQNSLLQGKRYQVVRNPQPINQVGDEKRK